ncbi:hypothetical protein DNTS_012337 [Danionella cerebrum]|uniref:GST C-terminal domain-containing protein n=1 Tax=Danionella cerebrum TaxID=2873325 RepID=A0A553NKF9_9TELE|nr:hypothetical protein DNTS_012337 [Danionella translucida]
MKPAEPQANKESLYLEVSSVNGAVSLPLHSSIVLFLLSYTDCSSFQVWLVSDQSGVLACLADLMPVSFSVSEVKTDEMPDLVRQCRLPAALEPDSCFCRAGLAVILRHVIQRACQLMPGHREVASLLGFKNTCLKACAEVSQWTRLCELDIPSAVEKHLQNPHDETLWLPPAILNLEKRLGEPVKVHNDDKIRRQKLQQQKKSDPESQDLVHPEVELSAALERLSAHALPSPSTRESCDIRRVKTTDLPPLEHVFAEGLYFTLTDVVLLPCIHQYLISLQKFAPSTLSHLPLLLRWYQRVQELPTVLRAAKDTGMSFLNICTVEPSTAQPEDQRSRREEHQVPNPKSEPFIGGPRPTLTKLQENSIDAVYSTHPFPSWTIDWENLPAAVNPTEGNLGGLALKCTFHSHRHSSIIISFLLLVSMFSESHLKLFVSLISSSQFFKCCVALQ